MVCPPAAVSSPIPHLPQLRPQHPETAAPSDSRPRSVAILNQSNHLVSTVDVGRLLKRQRHTHPHDAMLLPSGDLVVATWNPGRLSYWRRLWTPARAPRPQEHVDAGQRGSFSLMGALTRG